MKNQKVVLKIVGVVVIIVAAASYLIISSMKGKSILPTNLPGGSPAPAINTVPGATGSTTSKYPEGTLLRHANNDKVFYIDGLGYRHHVTSRSVLDRMGLSMSNVKSISLTEMQNIPAGDPIA